MQNVSYKAAQIIQGVSRQQYRLIGPASKHHPHVWLASSLSAFSGNGICIIKSSLRVDPQEQSRAVRQQQTEIDLLSGPLKAVKGIRQLIDVVETDGVRDGIYEHCDLDLYHYHKVLKRRFTRPQLKEVARQLFQALVELRARNIVHTDIKPENIVLRDPGLGSVRNGDVKIIDFGVASSSDHDRSRPITNPYWRSPESWLGLPWGPPADMWSVGAIIASLLLEPGAMLFQPPPGLAKLEGEQREKAWLSGITTMVPFPARLQDRADSAKRELVMQAPTRLAANGEPLTLALTGSIFDVRVDDWEFVTHVLQTDRDDRPTAEALLRHPWLSSSSGFSASKLF